MKGGIMLDKRDKEKQLEEMYDNNMALALRDDELKESAFHIEASKACAMIVIALAKLDESK